MYSTYILVHPRTQKLQNVLTLEDYQQIQALLEYVLKRQQQGYLQHVENQSREHLRLCQALYNNKLLALDYRRQRAAQLQRLLQHHHDQFHNCDRARLLAALEKHRAQQAFQRFIETYYQQNEHPSYSNEIQQEPIQRQLETRQEPIQQQSKTQQEPIQQQLETRQEPIEQHLEQTEPDESVDQEQDEEPIDNAYEQYQTQQLEDLLKHIFEKNSSGQHSGVENEEEEEYAYAPVQAQEDPQDEQTMADLLPLLDEKNDNIRDRYVDPTPTKAASPPATPSKSPEQSADQSYLPDNVLPLQDVLDELIRTPTPAVKSSAKDDSPSTKAPSTRKDPLTRRDPPKAPTARSDPKTSASAKPAPAPQPGKDPSPPPVPPKSTSTDYTRAETHPDRQRKLDQLSEIERKLDELEKENKNGDITHLRLQHQVNDQGRLFLDGNTPDNRKFLTYEDEIIRCMIQLDQILSDGDTLVRDRRRNAVKKAEALLEPVDRHKQDEWAKAQQTGKKKQHRHRHHKRKVRVPVTA